MKSALVGVAVLLLAGAVAAPSQAAVETMESCTDTLGVTVVTWDCDFEDLDYTLGSMVTFTVNWTVEGGFAVFEDFGLRKSGYTPKSKKDAVEGTVPVVDSFVDDGTSGSVTVSVMLTDLHKAGKSGAKGNGHFALFLRVDDDADGAIDDKASKFGVNLHVTDPMDDPIPEASYRRSTEDASVSTTTWGAVKRINRN